MTIQEMMQQRLAQADKQEVVKERAVKIKQATKQVKKEKAVSTRAEHRSALRHFLRGGELTEETIVSLVKMGLLNRCGDILGITEKGLFAIGEI